MTTPSVASDLRSVSSVPNRNREWEGGSRWTRRFLGTGLLRIGRKPTVSGGSVACRTRQTGGGEASADHRLKPLPCICRASVESTATPTPRADPRSPDQVVRQTPYHERGLRCGKKSVRDEDGLSAGACSESRQDTVSRISEEPDTPIGDREVRPARMEGPIMERRVRVVHLARLEVERPRPALLVMRSLPTQTTRTRS